MRVVAAALFLVVFVAACGKALPDTPSADTPSTPAPLAANPALDGPPGAPRGMPLVFGWDGVDGRMMMSSLRRDDNIGYQATLEIDPTTWTFKGSEWVTAVTGIPESDHGALVYDSKRNREVLVGPTQLWEWDGQSWSAKSHSIPGLPRRSGAYSPELRATVVNVSFGFDKPPTWLWDGTTWRLVVTEHFPPRGPIAYDPKRHSIIGLDLHDYRTSVFDGHDWSAIPLSGGASPLVSTGMGRGGSGVAFDQKRSVWVLFGGSNAIAALTETWISNGSTWTKQSPTTSPTGRIAGLFEVSFMAWDPSHGRALLFGGSVADQSKASLGDTWTWDGINWTQLAGSTTPA